MTGAIAATQYSVSSAPPVTVQLHNQEIDSVAYNATATSTYVVSNTGNVTDGGSTLEAWLTSGTASSYEVEATVTSGALTSGTTGSWLNCGSSNSWVLVNSSRNNSVKSAVFTVQIRDVATHTVQASASITLTAESDSRFG